MSEGMQYHAEGGDLEGCKEQMQTSSTSLPIATTRRRLHRRPAEAASSSRSLRGPDPFHPNYQYASPWANKKENKGRIGRPTPYKPPMQRVR